MSAAALSVWLEPYDEALASRVGVLCLRHADAMVVPRGWTLEDRREVARPLFRSPPAEARPVAPRRPARDVPLDDRATVRGVPAEQATAERPKRARRRAVRDDHTGQLELVVAATDEAQSEPSDPAVVMPPIAEPIEALHDAAEVEASQPMAAELAGSETGVDADGTPFNPWRPKFDQTDDLDGLLQARSPLLARAFRGKGPQGTRAVGAASDDAPAVDPTQR